MTTKNLKTLAFIFGLTALILISGFVTSKTLRMETATDVPPRSNVNTSFGEPDVKATGDSATDPRKPDTSLGNPLVRVWVNTKSGIYHCPNTPWYGDTRNGQYMTQREAQTKGYRPAYGIVCG